MHPRRPWIFVGLLTALTAQSAVIYKWTDANGVVHYSDQPVAGAERIVTAGKSSLNSYSGANSTANAQQPGKPGTATSAPPLTITIASPQAEQTFFNDEPISVSLSVRELKPEQSVTWHLNGKELDQTPSTTEFVLPNPGRGVFVITASIANQTTGDVQTTPSVTFYVHEPSLLSPQHRNP